MGISAAPFLRTGQTGPHSPVALSGQAPQAPRVLPLGPWLTALGSDRGPLHHTVPRRTPAPQQPRPARLVLCSPRPCLLASAPCAKHHVVSKGGRGPCKCARAWVPLGLKPWGSPHVPKPASATGTHCPAHGAGWPAEQVWPTVGGAQAPLLLRDGCVTGEDPGNKSCRPASRSLCGAVGCTACCPSHPTPPLPMGPAPHRRTRSCPRATAARFL